MQMGWRSRKEPYRILIHEKAEELSQERKDIFTAGLHSSNYQQIDDKVKKILYNNYDLEEKDFNLTEDAVFNVIVCDDAPQFNKVTRLRGLCWVHEERHYQKLIPIYESHKGEVEKVKANVG